MSTVIPSPAWSEGSITKFNPDWNAIIVFESNRESFHTVGLAYWLFVGEDSLNYHWKQNPSVLNAIQETKNGRDFYSGMHANFRHLTAFQGGNRGYSWRIVTHERNGKKRSVPTYEILRQLEKLKSESKGSYTNHSFIITPIGEYQGGYSKEEMEREVWSKLYPWPQNWKFTRFNDLQLIKKAPYTPKKKAVTS